MFSVKIIAMLGALFWCSAVTANESNQRSLPNIQLDYLKTVHSEAEAVDPTLTAMLLGSFINARQVNSGMQFFAELEANNTGGVALRYQTARAVLRAIWAPEVFLLKRQGWIKNTIAMFDEAREQEPNNMLLRWMMGTTLAQLPSMFDQQDRAKADLDWLLARFDQLPRDGLLDGAQREVYYQLACVYKHSGNEAEANRFLVLSGYADYERESTITSQFAASLDHGLTLTSPSITELVPNRVFVVSGFEMTEYYFIVSADGSQTLSIDAGTRPDTAQKAHEAVIQRFPSLPPVSTVLVTHTHWDHVGGHQYFRDLNPSVKFISSADFAHELDVIRSSEPRFKYFFSRHYSDANVAEYKPDATIDRDQEMTIGGSTVRLIPVQGGETNDGLFLHFPKLKMTFVGDFIMPYVGAPFANEGNPSGLLTAIDVLNGFDAGTLLHGHKPLTDIFSPTSRLNKLGNALTWLQGEFRSAQSQGLDLVEMRQLNLVPEIVLENPDIQLGYLAIRNGFLSRLYHQSGGYWTANLGGMLDLSIEDTGQILSEYLSMTKRKAIKAGNALLDKGHPEAALTLIRWALAVYPDSQNLEGVRRRALIDLRSRAQFYDPFKLVIYSELLGEGIMQIQPY